MAKHSSHILDMARKGAEHKYAELKAEIAALLQHFPHLTSPHLTSPRLAHRRTDSTSGTCARDPWNGSGHGGYWLRRADEAAEDVGEGAGCHFSSAEGAVGEAQSWQEERVVAVPADALGHASAFRDRDVQR